VETMNVAALSLTQIGWSLAFTLSGLLLMFLGLVLFDIVTPFKLFEEVQNGNRAVAWAAAGFLISTGIVLGDAFRDLPYWIDAMAVAGISILMNIVGYYAWELVTPKWSLNKSISEGNAAAGMVCCGIFVAVGLIVAGSF
jgi:putative membrane protein